MGSYTADKLHNFEFDGDQISCLMKSPSVETIKGIAPLMDKGKSEGNGDVKFSMTMSESMEFMESVAPFLIDSITTINGVKDGEGREVTLDVILTKFYFLNLVSILISLLFEMGEVSLSEVKK